VESQYTEADRAMCGVGDFVLRGSFVRHRLTVDAWRLLSAKQLRPMVVLLCLTAQVVERSHIIASENGQKRRHPKLRGLCWGNDLFCES